MRRRKDLGQFPRGMTLRSGAHCVTSVTDLSSPDPLLVTPRQLRNNNMDVFELSLPERQLLYSFTEA